MLESETVQRIHQYMIRYFGPRDDTVLCYATPACYWVIVQIMLTGTRDWATRWQELLGSFGASLEMLLFNRMLITYYQIFCSLLGRSIFKIACRCKMTSCNQRYVGIETPHTCDHEMYMCMCILTTLFLFKREINDTTL